MNRLTVEEIAKLLYENHEEQCCNCGPWEQAGWRKENFMAPANKVHVAIYGEGGEHGKEHEVRI